MQIIQKVRRINTTIKYPPVFIVRNAQWRVWTSQCAQVNRYAASDTEIFKKNVQNYTVQMVRWVPHSSIGRFCLSLRKFVSLIAVNDWVIPACMKESLLRVSESKKRRKGPGRGQEPDVISRKNFMDGTIRGVWEIACTLAVKAHCCWRVRSCVFCHCRFRSFRWFGWKLF